MGVGNSGGLEFGYVLNFGGHHGLYVRGASTSTYTLVVSFSPGFSLGTGAIKLINRFVGDMMDQRCFVQLDSVRYTIPRMWVGLNASL